MFAFLNYASSVEENVPVIIVLSVSESERYENITTILIITYIIEKKLLFSEESLRPEGSPQPTQSPGKRLVWKQREA